MAEAVGRLDGALDLQVLAGEGALVEGVELLAHGRRHRLPRIVGIVAGAVAQGEAALGGGVHQPHRAGAVHRPDGVARVLDHRLELGGARAHAVLELDVEAPQLRLRAAAVPVLGHQRYLVGLEVVGEQDREPEDDRHGAGGGSHHTDDVDADQRAVHGDRHRSERRRRQLRPQTPGHGRGEDQDQANGDDRGRRQIVRQPTDRDSHRARDGEEEQADRHRAGPRQPVVQQPHAEQRHGRADRLEREQIRRHVRHQQLIGHCHHQRAAGDDPGQEAHPRGDQFPQLGANVALGRCHQWRQSSPIRPANCKQIVGLVGLMSRFRNPLSQIRRPNRNAVTDSDGEEPKGSGSELAPALGWAGGR